MSSPTQQYISAPAPQQPVKKGFAIAAMVLGILAILGCLIPVLNIGSILLAVVAIVLGIVAVVQAKKPDRGGKGMAIAGIVLSVLAIIGAILANVLFGAAVNAVNDSIEQEQAADAEAATQFPGATAEDVVGQAGDTLTVGDITLTATPLSEQTDSVLDATYQCSTVTYVNNGGTGGSFNALDWSLQNPDGAALTWGAWGNNSLESGELAPGGTVSGDVCFESDAAPGQYVLLYDGSFWGEERGAWINTL